MTILQRDDKKEGENISNLDDNYNQLLNLQLTYSDQFSYFVTHQYMKHCIYYCLYFIFIPIYIIKRICYKFKCNVNILNIFNYMFESIICYNYLYFCTCRNFFLKTLLIILYKLFLIMMMHILFIIHVRYLCNFKLIISTVSIHSDSSDAGQIAGGVISGLVGLIIVFVVLRIVKTFLVYFFPILLLFLHFKILLKHRKYSSWNVTEHWVYNAIHCNSQKLMVYLSIFKQSLSGVCSSVWYFLFRVWVFIISLNHSSEINQSWSSKNLHCKLGWTQ